MGCNLNGQIHFGVAFEEYFEFPWGYDIDEWWAKIHNYVPLHQPYTPQGGYAEGWSRDDPRIKEYYQHQRDWFKANPLPVVLEYCGTGDCSSTIIALPNKGLSVDWEATSFDPASLVVTDEEIQSIKGFLAKYEIDHDEDPAWLLLALTMTKPSTILHDILSIVISLNEGDKFNAWLNISGHVDWLQVEICPKDDYYHKVFDRHGVSTADSEELMALKHELQAWKRK